MAARLGGAMALLCLWGCASSRLVLEKPIADQCTSIGLEGCPQLTEGVLLYVEGNEAEAKPKIVEGAKANVPDKLTDFASSLEMLSKLPGADAYMGPVRQIVAILSEIAKERAKEQQLAETAAKSAARTEESKTKRKVASVKSDGPVIEVDLTEEADEEPRKPAARPRMQEPESGTVVPTVENGAEPCQVGAFVATLSPSPGVCIRAATGPVVIEDLHASGACQADLFILGGSTEGARWLVHSPAKTPLHVTGGRLFVRANETLTIAVAAKSHSDVRCAVTWSGERLSLPFTSKYQPGNL